ncbi:hypothetical protein RRF57_008575 [Xylaria bambusicola]|uniref:Uncharacterized protein n=1 Tax=Xylaria bambusicola TaxID=326684 RepID=A0AAN7UVJ2_9PEZI
MPVRYFLPGTIDGGMDEAKGFNIRRRVDEDLCKSRWDEEHAKIGLTRSRATYWLSSDCHIGFPLWRGRRNCWPVPTPKECASQQTEKFGHQNTIFEDSVHWANHPEAFSHLFDKSIESEHHLLPIQILLHLVCSEWLTMLGYIKSRLNQIEMEVTKPKNFATNLETGGLLQKLHMWRRFIPLYREMVTETLRRVLDYSSIKVEMSMPGHDCDAVSAALGKEGAENPERVRLRAITYPLIPSNLNQGGLIRLSSVVTAVTSIN